MTVSRKEYNRQYYLDNKDTMREQNRVYRQENIEQIREYDRQSGREKYWTLRLEALQVLGSRCSMPHIEGDPLAVDARCLQIDHVNGGGTQENQRGWQWLARVKEHPEKYQLLCASHNWIKRHEKGEARGRPRAV